MSLRSYTYQDMLRRNASLHGQGTAFVYALERVTHAQLVARGARLAAGLARIGVAAGDRVAMLAPNCLEYVDLFAAASHLGAIVVPVNNRFSADEVAYVIADVEPTAVLVDAAYLELLPVAVRARPTCYVIGSAPDGCKAADELYLDSAVPAAAVGNDTPLLIIHTAAVDGRPRGAMLSHGGLMAASAQAQSVWQLTPADVHLGVLPLFHIGGIGLLLAAQQAGGSSLLLPRFDAKALVQHVDLDGGSLIGVFPPMLGALTDAAAEAGSMLAPLRVVTGIDAAETIGRFLARCPNAGFWSTYGQTETTGAVSLSRSTERPGSAGRPVGMNSVAVVDELDRPVPTSLTGEIVVRGPTVFHGYWRRAEDSTLTLRNGWHHTGDLGHLDADGYLWYDRRSETKRLIKSGGENVYPAEVERVILDHPAVAEVAVSGVPDAQWGEAVKATCVMRAGHTLDADALIEFVGQRLARYKRPRHVEFVTELPAAPGPARAR